MSDKKLILVIGATGAQGIAVIDALLAPTADGAPSPYAIRALTRDPTSRRARELAEKGVEIVQGSVEDLPTVLEALRGVYGAWVNTDSNTLGETRETYLGMRIFELAKAAKTVRHYVWSNLDYVAKLTSYDPVYSAEQYNGKGRVADFLKSQPSILSDEEMSWTCATTGVYMEMLNSPVFGPLHRRADGTYVFAAPMGQGHAALVSLADLGFFARYTFDHREETSAQDIAVVSNMASLDDIVAAFKSATGLPAVAVSLSIEEWSRCFIGTDRPFASGSALGEGSTWKENFAAFWNLWRDDVLKRDMDWIRSIHPNRHTVEGWMRETNYRGEVDPTLLKGVSLNTDYVAARLGIE